MVEATEEREDFFVHKMTNDVISGIFSSCRGLNTSVNYYFVSVWHSMNKPAGYELKATL